MSADLRRLAPSGQGTPMHAAVAGRGLRSRGLCKAIVFGLAVGFAAPASAAGTAREVRPVAGVERVVLRAAGDLRIRQGEREHLEIEAEPRLLPKIGSAVRDGVLYLEFLVPQVQTRHPLRFDLTVKRLDALASATSADVHIGPLRTGALRLDLGGSGNVAIESLHAARLETRLTGASDVDIAGGEVDEQVLHSTGSGNYAAGGLKSVTARVRLAGSTDATVHASAHLDVRIEGSGDLHYYGDPRVDQVIEGAGELVPAGPR